jgi:hypothetical protein
MLEAGGARKDLGSRAGFVAGVRSRSTIVGLGGPFFFGGGFFGVVFGGAVRSGELGANGPVVGRGGAIYFGGRGVRYCT